ncbi:MAG: hypothetical protein ACK5HR_01730 [Mycoplasmatales bacterium]
MTKEYQNLKVLLKELKLNSKQIYTIVAYILSIVCALSIVNYLIIKYHSLLFLSLYIIIFIVFTLIYAKVIVKDKTYYQIIAKLNKYAKENKISNKEYMPSIFLSPKKVKKFKIVIKDPITILRTAKTEAEFKEELTKFYNNLK